MGKESATVLFRRLVFYILREQNLFIKETR